MSTSLAAIIFAGIIGSVSNPAMPQAGMDLASIEATTTAPKHGAVTASPDLALLQASAAQVDFGVFQSVAISAASLPAGAKWQDARQTDYRAFFTMECETAGFGACDSAFATTLQDVATRAATLDAHGMLDLVNRGVNRALTYRADAAIWNMGDYWANPVEMAQLGAGDCEDYAIAKYWLLRSLGVADENLQLVMLQDTRRQLFHAVLIAHVGGDSYVLDNVSNRLLADADYGQYQPIMSFAGTKNFIHGFAEGTTNVAAMPADLTMIAPGSGL